MKSNPLLLEVAASQAGQKMIDCLQQAARVALHPLDGVKLPWRKTRVTVAF